MDDGRWTKDVDPRPETKKETLRLPFKFENLEVWKRSLEFADGAYALSSGLPREEEYNLKSQIRRAATSVSLNIAEGSIGQSDPEQARFLSMALRSLVEVIACLHLIRRREYVVPKDSHRQLYEQGEVLAAKLQAMRKAISARPHQIKECVCDDDVAL